MSKKFLNWALGVLVIGLGLLMVAVSAFRVSHPDWVYGVETAEVKMEEAEPTGNQEPMVAIEEEMMGKEVNKIEAETDEVVVLDAGQVEPTKVDYYLAYPGLLPDHPLYWAKMIRDRIWGWLIRDSQQEINWLMLMADKRLGAAKALIEGNKVDLGLTTASKGEKYLERAAVELKKAEIRGENMTELKAKLLLASQKHAEVLQQLVNYLQTEDQTSLKALMAYSERIVKELSQ